MRKLLFVATFLFAAAVHAKPSVEVEFCNDTAGLAESAARLRSGGFAISYPYKVLDDIKQNNAMSLKFTLFAKSVVAYVYRLSLTPANTRAYIYSECMDGRLLDDIKPEPPGEKK